MVGIIPNWYPIFLEFQFCFGYLFCFTPTTSVVVVAGYREPIHLRDTISMIKKKRAKHINLSLMLFITSGVLSFSVKANSEAEVLALGLSSSDYRTNAIPEGWHLRRWSTATWNGYAQWSNDEGSNVVKLHSKDALTFLEKTVDINLSDYPIVSWRWKVDNNLKNIDETTMGGDDHPIRLFFVFEPDEEKQSFWFRIKRFFYLDRIHGHPFGGRFTEYLWSSHLSPGHVINDPGKPWQKLMVVESGEEKLGQWISYQRNLYEDFKRLYNEEPRRLIFIGILNDTDHTGQEATSYIADLTFSRSYAPSTGDDSTSE